MRKRFFCCVGMLLAAAVGLRAGNYEEDLNAERSARVQRLTAPDGWLSLIGLHFLAACDNTLGSAADNQIVLAAGPARLGNVAVDASGRARLQVTPGVDVRVNGAPVLATELGDGRTGRPVTVTCGTVSFFVIERGGRLALRVRDTESRRRQQFAGIEYYPTDPTWRIEAAWEPYERPREVPIKNILGQESKALVLGRAVFTRGGHTIGLLPLQESPDDPLFFVISDLTSGEETYAAARFVYADPPRDGRVVLDFNRAINPPCAFTPFATCPLPPKENEMPIAVTAGEKVYRGEH
jgi:uncharacterized protein (DUF1684 family)